MPAGLDLEADLLDRCFDVAAEVAASRDVWPEGRDGEALQACPSRRVGDEVLVEAKLIAGANHPAKLREGALLVGDRAEDQRGDPGVERLIGGGELADDFLDHLDLNRRLGGCLDRRFAPQRLRLDGEHSLHGVGIEGEVEAVTGADLDHLSRQPGKQLAAVLVLLAGGRPHVEAGEQRVVADLLLREPRVLSRLRDELDGDDDTYLDAVVIETLRLRPVIDADERTLTKPRTIGGWDLPAGIRVYPAIVVVQLREDLYPR